jgi:hypothetical protein
VTAAVDLAVLRAPFDPAVVGKLPKVTCRDCSARNRDCTITSHEKAWCPTCKTRVSTAHMHVDFVGHAVVTDRLLSVDPEWSWTWGVDDPATGRPSKELSIERTPDGEPVALWMALTVGGITKRDVGYVEAGKSEPMKLLVADALCRAAMRFGVALELWAKNGLESTEAEPGQPSTMATANGAGGRPPLPLASAAIIAGLRGRMNLIPDLARRRQVKAEFLDRFGEPDQLRADDVEAAKAFIAERSAGQPELLAG